MEIAAGFANLLDGPWTKLNVVLQAVLIARLLWSGLGRSYPRLFAFLFAEASLSGLTLYFGGSYDRRAVSFVIVDVIGSVLFVLLLRELLANVLSEHKAIVAFAKRGSLYLIVGGIGIGFASLVLDPIMGKSDVSWLGQYYAVTRSLYAAGLVLALVAMGMTVWFPLNLKRNVSAILSGCVLLMVIKFVGFYTANLDPGLVGIGGVTRMFYQLCWSTAMIWWIIHLNPAGELATVQTGLVWDADRAARLTAQLQGINARLDSAYSRN